MPFGVAAVLAALIDLNTKTTVFKVGWFQITLANLIALVLIVVLFLIGLKIALPGRVRRDGG
jgi:hypothetical protein